VETTLALTKYFGLLGSLSNISSFFIAFFKVKEEEEAEEERTIQMPPIHSTIHSSNSMFAPM
jgi:hypothetical protein